MSELNLILLGPPGAGKGTQAERLEDDFHLPYIATGNMLRAAVEEGNDLGKKAKEYMDDGALVPDDLIIDLILECVGEERCNDGFLLDGFPRTIGQAEVLERTLDDRDRSLTAAMLITAPDEEVIRRLSGRRICVKNQHLYHVDFDPPKREGVCDQDGSRLIQRDDEWRERDDDRWRERDRDDEHRQQHQRKQRHGPEKVDQRLQMEIAARRDQAAEAVFG